jgi:leader peptidase (prepilin peptidase)/N-methyltransferase
MVSTLLFALVGFLAGVVVNRAADNLPPPSRRSLLDAPRCSYCGTARKSREQIAIIGFLLLRGRCRNCQSPLPLRGPIVEIAGVLLFAFLWSRFGATWTTIGYGLMTAILLLITVIDLEHHLILNVVVLPFTIVTLLLSPVLSGTASPQVAVLSALLGAAIGYLLFLGIYLFGMLFARVMARARGKGIDEVAFGFGDVKLAGLVGALVGFPGVIFALVYAILLGGVAAVFVLFFQIVARRRYVAFMAIPYGPFITIAAWVVTVWGRELGRGFSG